MLSVFTILAGSGKKSQTAIIIMIIFIINIVIPIIIIIVPIFTRLGLRGCTFTEGVEEYRMAQGQVREA